MSKKIIVGYDGTDQANDALRLGAAFAGAMDARLLIAPAIEFGPLEGSGPLGGLAYMEADLPGYEQAKGEYFDHIFGLADAELGGAPFERHPLQDTAAHGLTELAETVEADLVALGSTHRGPIRRVLAGTVATRLLHGAPCAVAVAPRGWRQRLRSRVDLVGVGYDGSAESKLAVAHAEGIAEAFGAELRIIAVAPYFGVDARLGEVEATRREIWERRVMEGAQLTSGDVRAEPVLRQGKEAGELALEASGLDLLVVGSRGYGPLRRALLGSVSTELVRTAPCPVVVVPRGAGIPSEVEAAAAAAAA